MYVFFFFFVLGPKTATIADEVFVYRISKLRLSKSGHTTGTNFPRPKRNHTKIKRTLSLSSALCTTPTSSCASKTRTVPIPSMPLD